MKAKQRLRAAQRRLEAFKAHRMIPRLLGTKHYVRPAKPPYRRHPRTRREECL